VRAHEIQKKEGSRSAKEGLPSVPVKARQERGPSNTIKGLRRTQFPQREGRTSWRAAKQHLRVYEIPLAFRRNPEWFQKGSFGDEVVREKVAKGSKKKKDLAKSKFSGGKIGHEERRDGKTQVNLSRHCQLIWERDCRKGSICSGAWKKNFSLWRVGSAVGRPRAVRRRVAVTIDVKRGHVNKYYLSSWQRGDLEKTNC